MSMAWHQNIHHHQIENVRITIRDHISTKGIKFSFQFDSYLAAYYNTRKYHYIKSQYRESSSEVCKLIVVSISLYTPAA